MNRAPTEAQALRVGLPTLAPMDRAAAGVNRPSHDLQAGSIQFPGVGVTPLRTQAEPLQAADRGRLRMNRFQAISLR